MVHQLYDEPILIRSVADRRDTVSIHSSLEIQAANSPIVAPKVTSVTASIVLLSLIHVYFFRFCILQGGRVSNSLIAEARSTEG